jgi:transposase-like protein
MIDFPITDWLDGDTCTRWLERPLHPEGLKCPHCGSADRRLFRAQGHVPAYRCRVCAGYYTRLTGAVFAKPHQPPATLVLRLRGVAKGEPTAGLARELKLSRAQLHTLRQRLHANLNETAPTDAMPGTAFEADELDHHAGKTSTPHPDPEDPPRRRANRRRGHGTYANDRPPIVSIVSRDTGEPRFWVCDYANAHACAALIAENVPTGNTQLYTDEWQTYRRSHPHPGTDIVACAPSRMAAKPFDV